jgi:spore coat protein CotH
MRLLLIALLALGCRKSFDTADFEPVEPTDTAPTDSEPPDTEPPTETGTDTEPPEPDPSDVLFDVGRVIDVRIELEPEDWEELRFQARSYASLLSGEDCLAEPFDNPYTWFPASAEIDGTSYDLVGVRKKGLIGSSSTTKPGLKIDLDEFEDNDNLHGLDKLTFNNSVQDPSYVRQCMAYQVMTAAGLEAPRCGFAHMWVNGEDMGIYVHVERIGGDFLDKRFGDSTGSLYEGTLSDFREGWTGTFEPKTDETDPDLAPIHAVIEALDAPDDGLEAALDAVIDLDAWYTFWAAEVLVSHWDGYAGNTNNFYVYAHPADGKLRFLPWGTDGALVNWFEPDGVYATGALARRVYQHPELGGRYIDRISTLLDTVWDEDALLSDLDRMQGTLLPEYSGPESDLIYAIDDVRTAVRDRRARIEDELGMVWTAPLREPPCLVEVGTISATFETTWGTLDSSPDAFNEGTVELDMTWGGAAFPYSNAGAIAGFSGDTPLAGVAAALPDGSYVLPYAYWFDTDFAAPGVTLDLDAAHGDGVFLYTAEHLGWEWYTIGYLTGGQLSFDAIGYEPGDTVRATMTASILGGG